ncbi:MAG: hypothetical protein HZC42_05720 [Candidatus Eisenbacteria bacterium]|nr:hypothetical protein [Candidatus Eisenbacteria bacterium]
MRGALPAVGLTLSLLVAGAGVARAGVPLSVQRVAPAADTARLARPGRPAFLPMRPAELVQQEARAAAWRRFPDLLSRPGVDWSPRLARPLHRATSPRTALAPEGPALAPSIVIKVAFLRVDFRADRGGGASTGDGHFDLSGPDTTVAPIDRPPHNRKFYQDHLEALSRYYSAQSYGRVVVQGEVWPRDDPDAAYSVSDMADFGPWTFSQTIYQAAVHMFRTMLFAADSQSIVRGDRIPWDSYDRIVIIHAGSDLQSDVRRDSKEDIPSFTIGVGDTDVVIFPDSTNLAIDRATIVPETANQDGYYGALNGVIAHECGHLFFGYADLYDIETGYPVVGFWSLMDSGNLVGSRVALADGSEIFATGLLPPSVDPWHRFYTTDVLAFPEAGIGDTAALANSERNPDVRRVTLSSDEYLLLENRHVAPESLVVLDQDSTSRVVLGPKNPDALEYDALLPGSGLLVWHVDSSVIPFESSLRINPDYGFNTDPRRLAISIVEADGLGDLGDPGSPYLLGAPSDPFFRSNNPALADSTFPNLRPHIGTVTHRQLLFVDDPAPVMHFSARRTWQLRGWPVAGDFPAGGPILLAVDADGDRGLEVCWAGGADSLVLSDGSHVANPDASALFAIRPDATPLDTTGGNLTNFAFAHLDRKPYPVLAAIATGEPGLPGLPAQGPSYFAVSTYADGPDTSTAGGRVWLLDRQGAPLPGWPASLPSIVTTPPVFAGLYPNAWVFVGCADGRVYAIGLDGASRSVFRMPSPAPVRGRLAAWPAPAGAWMVAAGTYAVWTGEGWVGVRTWSPAGTRPGDAEAADPGPDPGWPVRLVSSGDFAPEFLWLDFDGVAPPAGAPRSCGGDPALIVHHADRLWAFCPGGDPLPGWGRTLSDTLVAGLGAGDPDGDGVPEVLTQSLRSELAFWNRSGYPSPGWPRRGTPEDLRTASPALALDVDRDGRSEVVGMNGSGIVAALRADGRTPEGWPLASGSGAAGAPVAADLNRDGSLDLAVPDRFGILYAYTLPAPASDPVATSWIMLGGDPGRTSALLPSATPAARAQAAGPLVPGSLKAYPNPARRHPVSFAFTLSEPADVEVRILDTSGHEVASFARSGLQTDNVTVWDPGHLPAGLYLAHLRFRGARGTRSEVLPVAVLR